MAYGFLPPQEPLLSPYDCRVRGCPRRRKRLGGRLLELARSGEELIDDGRVGQGRDIAEPGRLPLGDLAQDAAHDLAGTGLGKGWCELDPLGRGDRPDLASNLLVELLPEVLVAFFA